MENHTKNDHGVRDEGEMLERGEGHDKEVSYTGEREIHHHGAVLVMVLVGIVGLGMFLSFVQKDTTVEEDTQQHEEITIADASQPVFALIYIADQKGYFADEGIDISYKHVASGHDALAHVIAGTADLATTFETPFIVESYEGYPLHVVSGLYRSDKNIGLVARREHGITTPHDLSGKTIGVSKDTIGEFFLLSLLEEHAISVDEVTIVAIEPDDISTALHQGTIDAIVTWNIHLFNAQRSFTDDEIVVFFLDSFEESALLVGMEMFIEERALSLQKFVRALSRAEDVLASSDREAQEITVQHLKHYSGSTIRAIWRDGTHRVAIPPTLIDRMHRRGLWLRENGIVTGEVPDMTDRIMR